jgi:hypothetical protein
MPRWFHQTKAEGNMQRKQDRVLDADDITEGGELDDQVQQAMLQRLFDFMDQDDDSPSNTAANKPLEKDNHISRNRCYSFFYSNKPAEINPVPARRSFCYAWFQGPQTPLPVPASISNKSHRSMCDSFLKAAPASHDQNTAHSPGKPK